MFPQYVACPLRTAQWYYIRALRAVNMAGYFKHPFRLEDASASDREPVFLPENQMMMALPSLATYASSAMTKSKNWSICSGLSHELNKQIARLFGLAHKYSLSFGHDKMIQSLTSSTVRQFFRSWRHWSSHRKGNGALSVQIATGYQSFIWNFWNWYLQLNIQR